MSNKSTTREAVELLRRRAVDVLSDDECIAALDQILANDKAQRKVLDDVVSWGPADAGSILFQELQNARDRIATLERELAETREILRHEQPNRGKVARVVGRDGSEFRDLRILNVYGRPEGDLHVEVAIDAARATKEG